MKGIRVQLIEDEMKKGAIFDKSFLASDVRKMRNKMMKTDVDATVYATEHNLTFDQESKKIMLFERDTQKGVFVIRHTDTITDDMEFVCYGVDNGVVKPLYKAKNILGTLMYSSRTVNKKKQTEVGEEYIDNYSDEGLYLVQGERIFFMGHTEKTIINPDTKKSATSPKKFVVSWGVITK